MKFSIIIPTLNEQKAIKNLLRDLRKQTYKNFEIIVVDAQSSDATTSIVLSYKKFLQIQLLTSNITNVSMQRNIGAKYSNGTYLVFLDADAGVPKNYLSRIVEVIQNKQGLHFATSWIKPDTNKMIDRMVSKFYNYVILIQDIYPAANASGLIIKKNLFKKSGGFNRKLTFAEDADLISRINNKGYKLHVHKEPLVTLSFRRFRKYGYTNTIIKTLYLNFYSFVIGAPSVQVLEYKTGGEE